MLTQRRRRNSDRDCEVIQYTSVVQSQSDIAEDNFFYQESLLHTEMSCRDRTSEFMSTVKNMQGRMDNGFVLPMKGKRPTLSHGYQIFMTNARQIGKAISSTFVKLEKLTILARKKTLFDDKPFEIQELTYIIKQDISSLNQQIAQLQEISKGRNYQSGRHMQSHSNSVVVLLQSKLASMSNDFKTVLERRTENLKHQKNRREQFTKRGPISSGLPASAVAGYNGSVLLSDEQASFSADVSINMDGIQSSSDQQQLLLIDEQDSYIQNRANTMQNIEATIVELGTIFQQLACMVKEQEEIVQRIDTNVQDADLNVEAAHSEILKYFQHVTSNRWLMLKVFGVLIVFFLIFVVFVA